MITKKEYMKVGELEADRQELTSMLSYKGDSFLHNSHKIDKHKDLLSTIDTVVEAMLTKKLNEIRAEIATLIDFEEKDDE